MVSRNLLIHLNNLIQPSEHLPDFIGNAVTRVVTKGQLLLLTAVMLAAGACAQAPTPVKTALPPTEVRRIVTLTPAPTQPLTIIGAADHVIGNENAFLTITMYGDFQCSVCVDVALSMLLLRQRYPDDVRIIWRHFPQAGNDKAMLAAEATEAASDQGKFWELHDLLYAKQPEWRGLSVDQFRTKLSEYAQQAGVPDVAQFNSTLDAHQYQILVATAQQEGIALGLKGVPALLFNDRPYSGRTDLFALENETRLRLLEKRWFKTAPPYILDTNKSYAATLTTAKGEIVIDLLPKQAPIAVSNFLFLARQGWYNGNTFHQVTDQIAETGDPSGTGLGTAGYNIVDEFNNGLHFDQPGMVAMANDPTREDYNTASSRFFITLAPLEPRPFYDGKYTIFGKVRTGLEILKTLTLRNPYGDSTNPNPAPGDALISVTVNESAN